MRILFHTSVLNFRGTAVAVFDYAKYNQEILGNESVIAYNGSINGIVDMGNEPEVIEKFAKHFELRPYNSIKEYDSLCRDIDLAYFLKAGHKEPPFPNVRTANHAVFQRYDPHGDSYAYISEWLSNKMSNGTVPFVPHIVDLPVGTPFEISWNAIIPDDAIVIGRYGGFDTFDIPFAKHAVESVLAISKRHHFIFANTRRFIEHPRVTYFNAITEPVGKVAFIDRCDGMIHARRQGESFGLAICEGLFCDKPVLAFNGGVDQHHIDLLNGTELLYNNEDEMVTKMLNIRDFAGSYRHIVDKFNPKSVMTKFKEVFIDE